MPMPFLNCPRCGLAINLRASFLAMENCPRCRARAGLVTPLYPSRLPARREDEPPVSQGEGGMTGVAAPPGG
jgi:hypothetical protein